MSIPRLSIGACGACSCLRKSTNSSLVLPTFCWRESRLNRLYSPPSPMLDEANVWEFLQSYMHVFDFPCNVKVLMFVCFVLSKMSEMSSTEISRFIFYHIHIDKDWIHIFLYNKWNEYVKITLWPSWVNILYSFKYCSSSKVLTKL